jgi:phosphate transport system substrate-binding protein
MDGEAPAKNVLDVQALGDIPQAVATNAEAIGIANEGVKTAGVKVVDGPKIERPLVLVSKGAPSKEAQKLLDYLKGEGQKHLR